MNKTVPKLNLAYLGCWLIAVSISFYLVKLTRFGPVYFLCFSGIFILALKFLLSKNWRLPADVVPAALLLIYVGITQFDNANDGAFINIVLGLAAYIAIRTAGKSLGAEKTYSLIRSMVFFGAAILLFDSLYRYWLSRISPLAGVQGMLTGNTPYESKMDSLIFADSNTTALVAVILLFTLEGVRFVTKSSNRAFLLPRMVLMFAIIFSFSRAAILATLAGYAFYVGITRSTGGKVVIFSMILSFSFIPIMLLMDYATSDGSFLIKLGILRDVLEFPPVDKLFGAGFGSAERQLGRATHILLVTYIYELGMVGLSLFLWFCLSYVRRAGLILAFPVFVASLSYFLYAGAPFLFVPAALFLNFKQDQSKRFGA